MVRLIEFAICLLVFAVTASVMADGSKQDPHFSLATSGCSSTVLQGTSGYPWSIFQCRPEQSCCRPESVCVGKACRPEACLCRPEAVCGLPACRPEPELCRPERVCCNPEPCCRETSGGLKWTAPLKLW
jgi:hypothetical protein